MSLSILENQTNLTATGGWVVIKEDDRNFPKAIESLSHADARNLALNAAAKAGVASPRIGNIVRPYAVDQSGKEVLDQTEQQIDHYRANIQIVSGGL